MGSHIVLAGVDYAVGCCDNNDSFSDVVTRGERDGVGGQGEVTFGIVRRGANF